MSKWQETGITSVKQRCYKASKAITATQNPNWLTQLSSSVSSELYSDSYTARDCSMILMLRILQKSPHFNEL